MQSGQGAFAQPENPQGVSELPDGGFEVELPVEEEELGDNHFEPGGHYENLVHYFPDLSEIQELGRQVLDMAEADKESREEWEYMLADGIKSLGLNPHEGTDNYGIKYEGMCTATHPLLLESAVKFQSKFTSEMLPPTGPARTQIFGKKTDEKELQAQRVQAHLNYQLTQEMPEYAEEMDKLGFHLPLYGSSFKKMYWDQTLGRPSAEFVHPDFFIVAENAKSLETAERYTHIIEKSPLQLQREIDQGIYAQPDGTFDLAAAAGTGENGTIKNTEDQITGEVPTHTILENRIHTLYEQHVYMELPDGIDDAQIRPYVITVEKETSQVLSIRRNWSMNDPKAQMLQWFVHYKYVPGFGFHGLGLIHLLGDMQKTLTVVLRSLIDAGQYANLQGGFKLKGIRLSEETDPIKMGEFRNVESSLQDITKALMPLPFKEPSGTLYQLLEYLTGASQKFADSTEQVIQDSSNYGPVGTTMALLEASVKFFSAIHKRSHRAQGKELKILARLNYEFLPEDYPYEVPYDMQNILRKDYDPKSVDVIPNSDPNITSQAHRISLAQSKLQAALQAPQLHNLKEVYKDFYIALGVEDIDSFMVPDVQAQPMDPMSDILAAVQNQPIKAFPGQNHAAHVMFKTAWGQDPTQGGSGMFQQALPAIQANIQEHQVMEFQEKMAAQAQVLGQQMAVTGAATDPATQEMLMAQAAQQVVQTNELLAQEKAAGGPAGMVAKAELMDAETGRMKEQRESEESKVDLGIKLLKTLVGVEREKTRAKESGRKTAFEETKVAAELLKEQVKLDANDRKENAKLASGERNLFAKEMAQDRREERKEGSDARRMGRNGRK